MAETIQVDYIGGFEVHTSYLGEDQLVMGLDRLLSALAPLAGRDDWPTEESGLYETMVFEGEDRETIYVERYQTRAEAVDGHHRAVARIRTDQ